VAGLPSGGLTQTEWHPVAGSLQHFCSPGQGQSAFSLCPAEVPQGMNLGGTTAEQPPSGAAAGGHLPGLAVSKRENKLNQRR
jgi:hypothetical protein